jgi:hypothetical protein
MVWQCEVEGWGGRHGVPSGGRGWGRALASDRLRRADTGPRASGTGSAGRRVAWAFDAIQNKGGGAADRWGHTAQCQSVGQTQV